MVKLRLRELVRDLQEFYILSYHGLLGLARKPFYSRDLLEQMDYAGAGSCTVV